MSKDRIMLTKEGREKLCKDLKFLKTEKRKEIAQALADARAHGDLSENAEYDAAKEAQAMNEKKIGNIEDTLIKAEIIDDSVMAKDEALLGANVKVVDKDTGDEYIYMLVSEEEADFENEKISISSPVGEALLGHKVGDVVDVKIPAGIIRYEILEITR